MDHIEVITSVQRSRGYSGQEKPKRMFLIEKKK